MKWNAPARLVFRIAAGFLSVVCFATAGMMTYARFESGAHFEFDSSTRGMVAMWFWGVLFLVVAIRGRILKRDIG